VVAIAAGALAGCKRKTQEQRCDEALQAYAYAQTVHRSERDETGVQYDKFLAAANKAGDGPGERCAEMKRLVVGVYRSRQLAAERGAPDSPRGSMVTGPRRSFRDRSSKSACPVAEGTQAACHREVNERNRACARDRCGSGDTVSCMTRCTAENRELERRCGSCR